MFAELQCPQKRLKILESKHDMKSDKMNYIIYIDLECSIKKQIDTKIIQKNPQWKKCVNIFNVHIQCQQFGDLITQIIIEKNVL